MRILAILSRPVRPREVVSCPREKAGRPNQQEFLVMFTIPSNHGAACVASRPGSTARGKEKRTCWNVGERRTSNPWRFQIRKRAYAIWEQEGRRHGRDLDHWLQAQAEVEASRFANWPEHIVGLSESGSIADDAVIYDQIEERAYQIWEREGRPDGHDLDHWLQAEAEIRASC
jgi:Protein of unknown function (DUF2934)